MTITTTRLNQPGARTIREARPLTRNGAQVVVTHDTATGDVHAYAGTELLKSGFLMEAEFVDLLEWFLTEEAYPVRYTDRGWVVFDSEGRTRHTTSTSRRAVSVQARLTSKRRYLHRKVRGLN